MNIAIFAVSKKGRELAYKIQKSDTLAQSRCVTFFDKEGLAKNVEREFLQADALIFICAAGIAVRMIAPYIEHKSKDPAVLVIDEGSNFCIPILSGHLGGANELARNLAGELDMIPVITTASDLAGLTAVDMFAGGHGLSISDFNKAKELTVALLEGEKIGVIYEVPDTVCINEADLPVGYFVRDPETDDGPEATGDAGASEPDNNTGKITRTLRISYTKPETDNNDNDNSDVPLTLIPRCLALGIGCRRGTGADKIRAAVSECLAKHGLYKEAIRGVYSIDLKSDEEGLLAFCDEEELPVTFYSTERLKAVEGDFTGSDFVNEVTGVDNVCERSALAGGGRLIVRKEAYDGVTVAVALASPRP